MYLLVAKSAYTFALCFGLLVLAYIAQVLVREIGVIWRTTDTYISTFSVSERKDKLDAAGEIYTGQFRDTLKWLANTFRSRDAASRPELEALRVSTGVNLLTSEDPLAGIALSFQGVDVSGLMGRLRSLAWQPEKLTGRIVIDGAPYGALNWTSAPALPASHAAQKDSFFAFRPRDSVARLVNDMACRVFWLHAASTNKNYELVHPDTFCDWAWLSREVERLDFKASRPTIGLSAEDHASLAEMLKAVDALVQQNAAFPPLESLRTRLAALSPTQRADADRVRSIETGQAVAGAKTFAEAGLKLASIVAKAQTATPPATAQPAAPVARAFGYDEALAGGQLVPGVPLMFAIGPTPTPTISAGPLVRDAALNAFIIVPAYAVPAGAQPGPRGTAVLLASGERVGHLEPPLTIDGKRLPIALIRITMASKTVTNELKFGGRSLRLREPALPTLGQQVLIASSNYFNWTGPAEGAVSQEAAPVGPDLNEVMFEVRPRISAEGSAGSPILAEDGSLLGISYASRHDRSSPLALKPLFDKLGLQLLEQ